MKHLSILFFLIFFIGCNQPTKLEDKSQANLDLASRYFTEIKNQGKIDLIDELFDENYEHVASEGNSMTREDLKSVVKRMKSMAPNSYTEIVEALADNEKVMFFIKVESDLPKIANPNTTVTKVEYNAVFVFWIKDNKIYKGRNSGGQWPFIKQVSGFEGGIPDAIKILSEEMNSDKTKK